MEDGNIKSSVSSPLLPQIPSTSDTVAILLVPLQPESVNERLEDEASDATLNTEEICYIHASTFCLFLRSSYFYYPTFK